MICQWKIKNYLREYKYKKQVFSYITKTIMVMWKGGSIMNLSELTHEEEVNLERFCKFND